MSSDRAALTSIEKHHYTIFLFDHDILSRESRVIVHKVQDIIIMVGIWCYNQSGVTDLLIMRDSHYGRICFKSVETLGVLFLSCECSIPRPYPIQNRHPLQHYAGLKLLNWGCEWYSRGVSLGLMHDEWLRPYIVCPAPARKGLTCTWNIPVGRFENRCSRYHMSTVEHSAKPKVSICSLYKYADTSFEISKAPITYNNRRSISVVLTMAHRLRRWPTIKTTLVQPLLFAWISHRSQE